MLAYLQGCTPVISYAGWLGEGGPDVWKEVCSNLLRQDEEACLVFCHI